jgi:class 3 adenylate cyclase
LRRLAAILAADVAGYSRLIGSEEGGTLARLKAIQAELIDPTIAAHNGRLVKTTKPPTINATVTVLRFFFKVTARPAGDDATSRFELVLPPTRLDSIEVWANGAHREQWDNCNHR